MELRNIKPLFSLAPVLILTACFKSEPKFKVGDCINPVDGAQIWKLTSVEKSKMKGKAYQGKQLGQNEEVLPDRIFAEVPCP